MGRSVEFRRKHNWKKVEQFIALALILTLAQNFALTSAAASQKLTVTLKSSLSGADSSPWVTADAINTCKTQSFIHGKTIKILNEKNQTIGLGKLSNLQVDLETGKDDDGDYPYWAEIWCKYKVTIPIAGKAQFVQMDVANRKFGCQFYFSEFKKKKWNLAFVWEPFSTGPYC
jgi:hypothetical protein